MKRNMHLNASPRIFRNASELRKNPTPAEEKLWEYLRDRRMEGEKFRRQHPISTYVLDFYCYRLRLGIEIDGQQHSRVDQDFYDEDRTDNLSGYHLHIIRFTNDQVIGAIEIVLDKIRQKINALRG